LAALLIDSIFVIIIIRSGIPFERLLEDLMVAVIFRDIEEISSGDSFINSVAASYLQNGLYFQEI
jgi:hypothetical protein